MVPQILSVIQRQFTGPARTRALGFYSAVVAVGAVSGQVLGGVLDQREPLRRGLAAGLPGQHPGRAS